MWVCGCVGVGVCVCVCGCGCGCGCVGVCGWVGGWVGVWVSSCEYNAYKITGNRFQHVLLKNSVCHAFHSTVGFLVFVALTLSDCSRYGGLQPPCLPQPAARCRQLRSGPAARGGPGGGGGGPVQEEEDVGMVAILRGQRGRSERANGELCDYGAWNIHEKQRVGT